MLVNINPSNAARHLAKFIESKTGNKPKHSEMLELVASLSGMDNYRALKAEEDSQNEAASSDKKLLLSRTILDWDFAYQQDASLDDVPAYRRTPYHLDVEDCGHQFRLMLRPEGIDPLRLDGHPVLDMLVEVNDGVPCVHLTNDPYDEMLVAVFGSKDGIYIRHDGGDWTNQRYAGGELAEIIERNGDNHGNGVAVVLDTADKYREEPALVHPIEMQKVTIDIDYEMTLDFDDAAGYPSGRLYKPFLEKGLDFTVTWDDKIRTLCGEHGKLPMQPVIVSGRCRRSEFREDEYAVGQMTLRLVAELPRLASQSWKGLLEDAVEIEINGDKMRAEVTAHEETKLITIKP